ncbi:hypothetical protein SELMODRAFT_406618 [Selaginella moellendorffii]|uniref:Uncharacterized protein n=1 Tax=Selaginella moellendorffii TaxID=88036 RepID=D8R0X6_SELML|nr:hypothetical protein SELMODRAFT_406618 [Selaginella moellendorffii]
MPLTFLYCGNPNYGLTPSHTSLHIGSNTLMHFMRIVRNKDNNTIRVRRHGVAAAVWSLWGQALSVDLPVDAAHWQKLELARALKLLYDNTTTFLFSDICCNQQLTAYGCPDTMLLDHQSFAHGNICPKQRHTHANALYWGAPWSIPAYVYDNEMEPSMTPLEPCQIRSIEAMGCISTFELGLQCRGPPVQFVIDGTLGKFDAKQVLVYEEVDSIWQNRVSTSYILLAVPTKALEYRGLDWVANYEDYQGMSMTLSARKFIQASHDRSQDPVKELNAVDAIGIRKFERWGLLFSEDALRDVLPSGSGAKLVPAKALFDDGLWDTLGVQDRVAKDAAVCDIMHSRGITEMVLLKSQDCCGRLDEVQDTILLDADCGGRFDTVVNSQGTIEAKSKDCGGKVANSQGAMLLVAKSKDCGGRLETMLLKKESQSAILERANFLVLSKVVLEELQAEGILNVTDDEVIALGMSLIYFGGKLGINLSDGLSVICPGQGNLIKVRFLKALSTVV